MDLSEPWRAVVPTLDGPVLRVLAGTTRPLTGRQVWRLAEAGSPAGVRKVLHRLVDQGLVTVSAAGAAHLYVANRFHVAWSTVESLFHLQQRLWERVAASLAGWEFQPVLAGVFGSAARGDGGTDSDIDLLLVRPDDIPPATARSTDLRSRAWAQQVDRLRDDVRSLTGNTVQILEVTDEEFTDLVRDRDPLVDSWRRDLRVLAGQAPWRTADDERLRRSILEARQ